MGEPFDVIVVGGGHNGLVAAGLLARRGARVTVLERRATVGGAATTEQPWGAAYKMSALSYVVSLMPPEIVRELDLTRHGYKIYPQHGYFVPYRDGRSLQLPDQDRARRHAEIEQFSSTDADAYERWDAWLTRLADVLGPLLSTIPPRIGSLRPNDLLDQARLAWTLRGLGVSGVGDVTRLFTASVADLLDEWFTSPQMQGVLSVSGVIGTWAGPRSPGTAFVMAHHKIGDAGEGQLGSWGFPEGGMGAVSEALRAAALAAGATVRTDAPVARIDVRSGRVIGVTLESGDELRADVVVAATHPKITFLDQIDRAALPSDFVAAIERWKTRSGTVKVNVAVDRLPEFTAKPGFDPEVHGGTIVLAESLDQVERAFQDAVADRAAALPFADICIPSVFDPTLAPEGHHVVSMFTQWVPHTWAGSPNPEELGAYAERVIARVEAVAPGFADSILHRQVIGPHEMEHEYGLIGGNIFHGELSPDQLFHMRPAPGYADFRTPISGLYQASSATHGGGGVTGIPGLNATRQIMHDPRSLGGDVRKAVATLAAVIFTCTLMVLPAGTDAAPHPLRLTVGTVGSIGSLDPRHGFSTVAKEVWNLQYPTLTSLDPKTLDPAPGLASGWRPTPGGRGWIYTLRPGLKWSDGQPLTADDVVYSITRNRDEWPYATGVLGSFLAALTARALGPRSVEVTPKDIDRDLPGLLVHVVPEHVFSKVPDLNTNIKALGISDGAWHVTATTRDSVQLDAAAGPNGPAVQQIVFRTYPNAGALIDALAHKQLDVVSGVPDSDIGRLEALPDVTVNHAPDGRQFLLRDRLDDEKVRQAISLAIDRTALVAGAVHGVGTPGVVPVLARGATWSLDDSTVQSLTDSLDAQPDRARRLLAEAAPLQRTLTMGVSFGDSLARRVATRVQRSLAAVGVKATIVDTDENDATYDLSLYEGTFVDNPFYPSSALALVVCDACGRPQHLPSNDFTTLISISHSRVERATEQANIVGLFEPDTLQAFRSDNVSGWLREPQQPTLVVFGPTVSQYGTLVAAPPLPGEKLSNASYAVGAVIVLAACGAAYAIAAWIRRRYVLSKENHAG